MSISGNLETNERNNGHPKGTQKDHDRSVAVKTDQTRDSTGGVPFKTDPFRPGNGREAVANLPLEDAGEPAAAFGVPWEGAEHGRRGGRKSTAEPPEWTRDPKQLGPQTGGLWCAVIFLGLALIGAGAYSYLTLRGQNAAISQIPSVCHSLGALGDRVEATETKLQDLATNWDQLGNHVAALDRKVNSTLQTGRHQTQQLITQAEGRLEREMNQRGQLVDARLSQVEQNQSADHARLAQLNNQLENEVAALHGDLAATQDGTTRGLASLHDQVIENEGGLQNLTQQLHRERMNFEVVKNSPTELAPGISLTVLKTNTSYQRIRGYVSLTADGRTLWLDNLGAHEALDLYLRDTSHPYSLIITRVNPHGVVGYLLAPAGA